MRNEHDRVNRYDEYGIHSSALGNLLPDLLSCPFPPRIWPILYIMHCVKFVSEMDPTSLN